MERFVRLFRELDSSTRLGDKQQALVAYFREAPPGEAAWALYLLSGNKIPRIVNGTELRQWAAEAANLPLWLIEESHEAVGDLGETIALVIDKGRATSGADRSLDQLIEQELLPLRGSSAPERRSTFLRLWNDFSRKECFIWNKLVTGSFRVGVQRKLLLRALAEAASVPEAELAHRLMGDWKPSADHYRQLLQPAAGALPSRPYPFFLAYPLDLELESLGSPEEWFAEWKWDGIRAQAVCRGMTRVLWSRGEEMINQQFPDLMPFLARVPDQTVLDGEIVPWRGGKPLSFGELQRRLGRKSVSPRLLEEVPVHYIVYDILEWGGQDIRSQPLVERRQILGSMLPAGGQASISPLLQFASWQELALLRTEAERNGVEGLMLKHRSSSYEVGRKRGMWWKWKVEPFTVDAVLLYAQRGSGRRAGLYTDYTFGVWREGELVPIAKAYSGLTDAEITEVHNYVRAHTTQRFGPVRQVTPQLVFELAFDGIRASGRHRSGVALRFPRIKRWRRDKGPADADSLLTLQALIAADTSRDSR